MDLEFFLDGKMKFSGFHHDFMEMIEKSGAIQFVNKVVDKSGFYKADLIVNGKLFKDKGFFPSNWSRKQVVEAILETYDKFQNEAIKQVDGKWLIEGATAQGINIRMFVTEGGVIVSAFPIFK